MTYKVEPQIGTTIQLTITKAKELSAEVIKTVEFNFNGITCLVDATTNTEWLERDYFTAMKMGWKQIGPNTLADYTSEIKTAIANKDKEIAERQAVQQAEWKMRDEAERAAFAQKTGDVEIEWLDKPMYDDWKAKNTDSYGAGIFEYAESWAKLMQYEMKQGRSLIDCAKETSFQLSYLGISGYMYGAAVNVLANCWGYGELLRKWHNGEYNHKGEGVVNPAILTISS